MCGHCEGKNKAVYMHKECYHYGLCKECYDKGTELRFPKEEYKAVKQPKKKELEKCDHMFDLHKDGVKRCRYCNEVSVGTLH